MIITAIRSDAIYRKMKDAAPAEKENIYRDELMKPFEFKWACVGIPLKAETEGGCDVVSAAAMSGYYAPAQITQERSAEMIKSARRRFGQTAKTVSAIPSQALSSTESSCRNRSMCLQWC